MQGQLMQGQLMQGQLMQQLMQGQLVQEQFVRRQLMPGQEGLPLLVFSFGGCFFAFPKAVSRWI
jgi:hypothetical protein